MRAVPLVVGLVGAVLVWVVGFVGIGQYGEDLCLDDLPATAGSYRGEGSSLPPLMTCVYQLADGSVARVEHGWYASARSAWTFGFPAFALIGLALVGSRPLRRPRRS